MIKLIRTKVANAIFKILGWVSIEPKTLPTSTIQQRHPDDIDTIQELQGEVAYFEYIAGSEFVRAHRINIEHRLKTIAKLHLKKALKLSEEDWIYECRALVRYFAYSKEKDALIAREMLMPFELKYQQARLVSK